MRESEAKEFEEHPVFETTILMRKWDDLAKEISIPIIDLGILPEKTSIIPGRV